MATIREVKNEVNYLSYEVIGDCETFMGLHPEKKDETMVLIEEAVALRNDLVYKINHPEEKSNKYFKQIKTDLVDGVDVIFEKLRKLIK